MDQAGIFARQSTYLDHAVQLGVASGRVISVSFPAHPPDDAGEDHPLLDRIDDYLGGIAPVDFADVEVALTVPTDQRAVLERLRGVPYGENVTVERLAAMTAEIDPDEEDDIRLVRTALVENPIPLVIPDHRVRDGPSAAPPAVEGKLRSLEGL